jgi:mediator of RNA polymerase II transcription subunit 10
VVQYVEDGRNPDIYTREFVELVAKSNQLMNGKRRAFMRFRDVLAEQIEAGFPELTEEVRKVQEGTGGKE